MRQENHFDVVVIGSGVSGSTMARSLSSHDLKVLVLEAGQFFYGPTYPRKEIDGNSQMYWGGGAEFNQHCSLALLRPKVVGGGSVVNQALLDPFDELAWNDFRQISGIEFFNSNSMGPYYQRIMENQKHCELSADQANGNAQIFAKGMEQQGHQYSLLTRSQQNCEYEKGNDCIGCLQGCRIYSKQSMHTTALVEAIKQKTKIHSRFEVLQIKHYPEGVKVWGKNELGQLQLYQAKKLILAGGAIGNTKLLLQSGFRPQLPALGEGFYCHPQYMMLGIYAGLIDSHKGPLQTYKSSDPKFRQSGFKLENVFAPPVAISMLVPGVGQRHQKIMQKLRNMACIEACIRDETPGSIQLDRNGRLKINKKLGYYDRKKRRRALQTIKEVFYQTGAKKIIPGQLAVGLHLMGGLAIGNDEKRSVVNSEFQLHGFKNIYVADSSIFPCAPGINPSLSIMALSLRASEHVVAAL